MKNESKSISCLCHNSSNMDQSRPTTRASSIKQIAKYPAYSTTACRLSSMVSANRDKTLFCGSFTGRSG